MLIFQWFDNPNRPKSISLGHVGTGGSSHTPELILGPWANRTYGYGDSPEPMACVVPAPLAVPSLRGASASARSQAGHQPEELVNGIVTMKHGETFTKLGFCMIF